MQRTFGVGSNTGAGITKNDPHDGQAYFMTHSVMTRIGDTVSEKMRFLPPTLAAWAEDVENDDSPSFVIKDVLPADNLILLSGQPKDAKKTWFAMLTALVAATGVSLPSLSVIEPVPVLYIYREGARRSTLQRFKALAAGHGLPAVGTIKNLYFQHRGNFWLDQGHWVGDVCEFIEQHNIKVVYIDTFAKSMQSDENSSREVGVAVHNAEKMRDAGATVVLVHHLKKGAHALSNGRSGTPEPDKDLRGSSALAGAYETHWAIRSYPSPDSKKRETQIFIGGKEAEWTAFTYDWDFVTSEKDGEKVLDSVRLDMKADGDLPFISSAESDSKGDGWAV